MRNGEDYNQWGLVAEAFSLSDWANMMLLIEAGTEEVCGKQNQFGFGMSLRHLSGKLQARNMGQFFIR